MLGRVRKTVKDILPLSQEAIARIDKLKEIRDEDIDTSDMLELTRDQLARMHRGDLFGNPESNTLYERRGLVTQGQEQVIVSN